MRQNTKQKFKKKKNQAKHVKRATGKAEGWLGKENGACTLPYAHNIT